jgi:hypothetical protein
MYNNQGFAELAANWSTVLQLQGVYFFRGEVVAIYKLY